MEVCFYPLSVCTGTRGNQKELLAGRALPLFIVDEQTAEAIGGLVLFLRVASFPL